MDQQGEVMAQLKDNTGGESWLRLTTWEIYYEYNIIDTDIWRLGKSAEFPDEPSAIDCAMNFFKGHAGYRNVEVVEVVRTVRWVMPSPTEEGRVVLQSEIDEWKVRQ